MHTTRTTATKAHGGGFGAAMGTLVTWTVGQIVPEMPAEVQASAAAVLIVGGGWLGAYFAPPNREKTP